MRMSFVPFRRVFQNVMFGDKKHRTVGGSGTRRLHGESSWYERCLEGLLCVCVVSFELSWSPDELMLG